MELSPHTDYSGDDEYRREHPHVAAALAERQETGQERAGESEEESQPTYEDPTGPAAHRKLCDSL